MKFAKQDMIFLKASEEEKVVKILEIFRGGVERASKEDIRKLATYPVRLLYSLSEISPEINKLLESNDYLNTNWSEKLKSLEYPDFHIVSFDGKIKLSLFSQLKGAFLLSELGENPNFNLPNSFVILNKACDIGMFQALVHRLNFYSDLIEQKKEIKSKQEEIADHIQVILRDAHKLSNLYWAIGCMDSAIIIFKIVNYYFDMPECEFNIKGFFLSVENNKFSWLGKYDSEDCPVPVDLLKTAVEYVYTTQLLSGYPPSKRISDQITHGEGLQAGLDESFSSPEALQKFVENNLNNLRVPIIESFCKQAYKHSISRIHKHHLDINIPDEL